MPRSLKTQNMSELAPGSILQKMYLKERIAKLKPKRFCEIGSGNGYLSRMLLDRGASGMGFDLNEGACENNKKLNADYISAGKYQVVHGNFFDYSSPEKFDYIISCMVIEHLDPETVNQYFQICRNALAPGGTIALLVPANMKFWGIEDEIAGHFKRYMFDDFKEIAATHKLKIADIAGLNYPVSNWLLSLSNKLVNKGEGHKKDLSMQEQTVESGNRNVMFKTTFPWYFRLALNDVTMLPFHMLQKMNRSNENSLVIYCELQPAS